MPRVAHFLQALQHAVLGVVAVDQFLECDGVAQTGLRNRGNVDRTCLLHVLIHVNAHHPRFLCLKDAHLQGRLRMDNIQIVQVARRSSHPQKQAHLRVRVRVLVGLAQILWRLRSGHGKVRDAWDLTRQALVKSHLVKRLRLAAAEENFFALWLEAQA